MIRPGILHNLTALETPTLTWISFPIQGRASSWMPISSSPLVLSPDSSVCPWNGICLVLARWFQAVDWVWERGEIHLLFMLKAFVKPSLGSYLERVVLQLMCSAHTTGCPCSAAPMPGWNCLLNCPSKQEWNSVKAFKGLALKAGAFSRVDKRRLAGADHTGWRLLCCCC